MSAQELAHILKLLKESGPVMDVPLPQARTNFETFLAKIPIASDLKVAVADAGGVPSLWIDTPGAQRNRILLYLHGGGYVVGSAMGYRSLAGEIGRATKARSLAIDYRLAPEHPFPASIDDVLTAYCSLLDGGTAPKSIVFAGNSAGGGLCLAVMLAARDANLPLPAASLLISPWLDLECTAPSMTSKNGTDPSYPVEGLLRMAALYRGATTGAGRGGLLAPLSADLSGLPPLLVQVGSSELLLDDATRLAMRTGAANVQTRLEIWANMIHDWPLFSPILAEGRDAIRNAGAFLDAHLGAHLTGRTH